MKSTRVWIFFLLLLFVQCKNDYENVIKLSKDDIIKNKAYIEYLSHSIDNSSRVDTNEIVKLYHMRADFYKILGEYQEAINDYSEAIDILGDKRDIFKINQLYEDRANTYFLMGKYQKAIKDNSYIVDYCKSRNNIEPWEKNFLHENLTFRAVNYTYIDDYEKAITDLNEALAINPRNALAHFIYGNYYSYHQNDKNNALKYYRNTVSLKGDYSEAFYEMGLIYLELGMKDSACVNLRKAHDIEDGKTRLGEEDSDLEKKCYKYLRTICKDTVE